MDETPSSTLSYSAVLIIDTVKAVFFAHETSRTYTLVHVPRRWGHPPSAGDLVTFLIGCLVFLISCLIVGMLNRIHNEWAGLD